MGCIYALEQIAKESPEEYLGTVIEVLSAFVRNAEVDEIKEDAKKPEEKKEVKTKIKHETQIAVTVLGRIRTEENKKHWGKLPRINMDNAILMGANLWRASLTKVDLREADLTGARFRGADLTEAKLTGANFTEAKHLSVGQLLKTKALYKVRGLPPEMEKELKIRKPELFENPLR